MVKSYGMIDGTATVPPLCSEIKSTWATILTAFRIMRRPSSLQLPNHPSYTMFLNFKIILSPKGLYCLFNDPSAGSPTDTVLRLLHPLDNVAHIASTSTTKAKMSTKFAESSNRLKRRAVCTKGRDAVSTI